LKRWKTIAAKLPNRTAKQIHQRWSETLNPTINRQPWTAHEDQQVRDSVAEHGTGKWALIARKLDNGRTANQIKQRWKETLSPNIMRQSWTADEDRLVSDFVAEHGTGKWSLIARKLDNGRTPKQIHTRWTETLSPAIKRNSWTADEDQFLCDAVAEHGAGKWSLIARKLNNGRTAHQIQQRWNETLNRTIRRQSWAVDEDQIVRDCVAELGTGKWSSIARKLDNGRTSQQIMHRWSGTLNPTINRQPWKADEDEIVRDWVADHRTGKWSLIARKLANGRTPQQIKLRWKETLNPTINRKSWKADEDQIVRDWISDHGSGKWSLIARKLDNGRTAQQIRTRWQAVINPAINRHPWTMTEDMQLVELVEEHGRKWAYIRNLLANGRTAVQLRGRYKTISAQNTR
jgi:hypothetical protein